MSWQGIAAIAIAAVINVIIVYLAFAHQTSLYPFSNPQTTANTPIPTPPTETPDLQATITAAAEATMEALPTPTPTPTTETPTLVPAPTPTPVPTLTPTPSPQLPAGIIEVTYPHEMIIEQNSIITVEIEAIHKIVATDVSTIPDPVVVITVEKDSQDAPRQTVESRLRLYPLMWAELRAPNFDQDDTDDRPRREIRPEFSAAWVWNITPRKTGIQKITINIYGETTAGGQQIDALATSKSLNINVLNKPLFHRMIEGFIDNLVPILGTGGPLGLVIAFLQIRSTRANKKLEEKIQNLEARIGGLENGEQEIR